jgi:ERF superfamily
MLAHASGEWIASDWPVCPIAETANPQRMGASLTYARRYALFTLVGIAGEDDLDAPDLCHGPLLSTPQTLNRSLKPTDGQSPAPSRMPGNGHARVSIKREAILDPDQSATLREKLLTELGSVTCADSATTWARQALSAKNSLNASDARLVEDAFERKLSEFQSSEAAAPPNVVSSVIPAAPPQEVATIEGPDTSGPRGINKSVFQIAAARRYRNREHLRYVSQQACLVCGRKPSDPHHLRHAQTRALGRKASDEFVVPLCRAHHRAVHRVGDERAWWKATGIDPLKVAGKLWRQTRMSEGQIRRAPATQPVDSDRILASSGVETKVPAPIDGTRNT